MIELQAGDIVFFEGAKLGSRLIRFFSTPLFKKRTKVNHVGVIVEPGSLYDATIVEATGRVKRRNMWEAYHAKGVKIAVFRPLQLTKNDIDTIVSVAESYVGREYGYLKIVTHLMDWFIGGKYFFRRLTTDDRYPICSWLVAAAYNAVGENFGGRIQTSEPDDIWDYCASHSNKFQLVMSLTRLPDKE